MSKWLIALVCILIALWSLFPAYLTLQTSLLGGFRIASPLDIIPHLKLINWRLLPWKWFLPWIKNSLIVCGLFAFLATFLTLLAGYGFAKYDFPGKEILFWVLLLSMMIPGVAMFLPKFLITKDLGLFGNYGGLIFPLYANAAGIFLIRQYYQSLSDEMLDAARIDGANEFQLFRYIVIPLTVSMAIYFFVGAFMSQWGNFMWQFIIAKGADLRTFAVGSALFIIGSTEVVAAGSAGDPGWLTTLGGSVAGLQAAMSIVQAVPILIFYAVGQRFFIENLRFGVVQE